MNIDIRTALSGICRFFQTAVETFQNRFERIRPVHATKDMNDRLEAPSHLFVFAFLVIGILKNGRGRSWTQVAVVAIALPMCGVPYCL